MVVGEGLTYLLTGIDGRWWGRVDVEGGNLSALMGGWVAGVESDRWWGEG